MATKMSDIPPRKVFGHVAGGTLDEGISTSGRGSYFTTPCVLMTVARYQAARRALRELIEAIENMDWSHGRAQQEATQQRLQAALDDLVK